MNLLRFKKGDPTYGFLSNYYPCSFVLDGIYYLNAEAAFQAQKVPLEERRQFACLMPNEAKKLGRRVQLSPDWECPRCKGVHGQNKLGMMLEEIRTKLR